jgi:hypothetical protein
VSLKKRVTVGPWLLASGGLDAVKPQLVVSALSSTWLLTMSVTWAARASMFAHAWTVDAYANALALSRAIWAATSLVLMFTRRLALFLDPTALTSGVSSFLSLTLQLRPPKLRLVIVVSIM